MLRLAYRGWSRVIDKGCLDLSPIRAWLKETNRIIQVNMTVDYSRLM
jgi:hypothetical protein